MKYLFITENTKNIFFDFDGVLVDSNKSKEISIKKAIQNNCNDKKKIIDALTFFNKYAGISREKKLKKFFQPKVIKKIMDDYSLLCYEFYEVANPTKGSYEFIQNLSKLTQKINLFILSGGEKGEIKRFIKRNNMNHFFKGILSSEDNKINHIKKTKPSEDDIFFGDTFSDLNASRKSRINFVYVYGFKSKKSCLNDDDERSVNLIIKDFTELKISKINSTQK